MQVGPEPSARKLQTVTAPRQEVPLILTPTVPQLQGVYWCAFRDGEEGRRLVLYAYVGKGDIINEERALPNDVVPRMGCIDANGNMKLYCIETGSGHLVEMSWSEAWLKVTQLPCDNL